MRKDISNWRGEDCALEMLVGETVTGLFVKTEGEESLLLVTLNNTAYELPTEGDCCSYSWWADAVGVKQLLGGEITKAEYIDMPEGYNVEDGRTRQEYDRAYGIRVTTNLGVCDLIFRNSSNGYYGGWAMIEKHDTILGLNPAEWERITEDWRA